MVSVCLKVYVQIYKPQGCLDTDHFVDLPSREQYQSATSQERRHKVAGRHANAPPIIYLRYVSSIMDSDNKELFLLF